jgi:hypothetical protein
MMRTGWTRGAAALLLAAALAACDRHPVVAPKPDPVAGLGPGIHPVLVLGASEGGAQVELHLRRVQVQAQVASYQGELLYDAAKLRLERAQFPAGVAGAWNEVQPGRVRFAGAASAGVPEGAVLTLRFTALAPPVRESFALVMEEVVAHDFSSLTGRVSRSEHPLFSRTPLPAEASPDQSQ